MDSGSYRTAYWQGREYMPGESMRFMDAARANQITRMHVPRIGGNIAPLFDRDKSGKICTPRPHRAGEEDYSIGAYLTQGNRREYGKLLDALNKRTRKGK